MKHSFIYNSRNLGQSVKVDHPNICSKLEFIYEHTAATWHILGRREMHMVGVRP